MLSRCFPAHSGHQESGRGWQLREVEVDNQLGMQLGLPCPGSEDGRSGARVGRGPRYRDCSQEAAWCQRLQTFTPRSKVSLPSWEPEPPDCQLFQTNERCLYLSSCIESQESYCENASVSHLLGTQGLQTERETERNHLFSLPKCHGQLFMPRLTGCV